MIKVSKISTIYKFGNLWPPFSLIVSSTFFLNYWVGWPTLQQFGFPKLSCIDLLKIVVYKPVLPKKYNSFSSIVAWKFEFIDLSNMKISNNHNILLEVSHFKPTPTKNTQKLSIPWLQFNLEGILNSQFTNLIQNNLVIKIIDPIIHSRSKIQNLQVLFPYQLQILPPNCNESLQLFKWGYE